MKSEQRTVIDTGVIVSAVILPRSIRRQAFDRAIVPGRCLLSSNLAEEIEQVLRRPGFNRYVSEEERMEFLAGYIRDTTLIAVHEMTNECRDPNDNMILELAVSGNATVIMTGDQDLLILDPFRGIPIVTPSEFLT